MQNDKIFLVQLINITHKNKEEIGGGGGM